MEKCAAYQVLLQPSIDHFWKVESSAFKLLTSKPTIPSRGSRGQEVPFVKVSLSMYDNTMKVQYTGGTRVPIDSKGTVHQIRKSD